MQDGDPSPELEQLERALVGRRRPAPSPELRDRVMAGVRDELRREWSGTWVALAGSMAAAAVLWLNLLMSTARATDGCLGPDGGHRPIAEVAGRIQRLLPEISKREAMRQAILHEAGLAPCWRPSLSADPAVRVRMNTVSSLLSEGG